jgi:hypothetical protein
VSSTNRGGKRSNKDFYCTPPWCVTELYQALFLPKPTLDPCAGNGGLIAPVKALQGRHSKIRGIEIQETLVEQARDGNLPVTQGNGLELDWSNEHVLINPPYSEAEVWITKAVREAKSTVALLRLAFLASKRRKAWIQANPPQALIILSKRPSFIDGKGGDSADYAWFYWSNQSQFFDTKMVWIG